MLHVDSEGKKVHQTVALQRRGDFLISLRNLQVSNNHCSVLLSIICLMLATKSTLSQTTVIYHFLSALTMGHLDLPGLLSDPVTVWVIT